jgi:tripartite-type tricarboxylate transporter receptor subunit TctC
LLVAALALTAMGQGHAQAYPNKPIRMVVPYAAGGNADITARLIAKKMSDNKGSANGMIGTDIVAKALPQVPTMQELGYKVFMGALFATVVLAGAPSRCCASKAVWRWWMSALSMFDANCRSNCKPKASSLKT